MNFVSMLSDALVGKTFFHNEREAYVTPFHVSESSFGSRKQYRVHYDVEGKSFCPSPLIRGFLDRIGYGMENKDVHPNYGPMNLNQRLDLCGFISELYRFLENLEYTEEVARIGDRIDTYGREHKFLSNFSPELQGQIGSFFQPQQKKRRSKTKGKSKRTHYAYRTSSRSRSRKNKKSKAKKRTKP